MKKTMPKDVAADRKTQMEKAFPKKARRGK